MRYLRDPSGPEMPAGPSDRDRTADVLRAAYVEGRLTDAEFGERQAAAARAATYADLAGLIADVPVGPLPWQHVASPTVGTVAHPPVRPVRHVRPGAPDDWRARLSASGTLLLTCLGTIAVILLVLVVIAGVTLGGVSVEQSIPVR